MLILIFVICLPLFGLGYNNYLQWFVGYFEEENTYSVIPNNWITRQDNNVVYCKWPRKQKVTTAMLTNAIEPSNNWSLYPVNLVEGLCFDNYDDNYDEAAKKERQIFLSASESDRGCKRGQPKKCSRRKQLFNDIDNTDDSDSSNNDQPIKVLKKHNEVQNKAVDSMIGNQEVYYDFNDQIQLYHLDPCFHSKKRKPLHHMSKINFKRCLEADKKAAISKNCTVLSSSSNKTTGCKYFDVLQDQHSTNTCIPLTAQPTQITMYPGFIINLSRLKYKCIFIPVTNEKAVASLMLHT